MGMFSDFDKAFKKPALTNQHIPKEIVEMLNRELPEGFEYVAQDNGSCVLRPLSKEALTSMDMTSSFVFDDPKLKELLKRKHIKNHIKTYKDIMDYLYRTQRVTKVKITSPGMVKIADKEFTVNDFIVYPLKDVPPMINGEQEATLHPEPFPPSEMITIIAGGVEKEFPLNRVPYDNMEEILLESDCDNSIQIKMLYNETTEMSTTTLNIDIYKSKTIQEILDACKFFMGFLSGHIVYNGEEIFEEPTGNFPQIPDGTIEFWEKVLELQNELGVNFVSGFKMSEDDYSEFSELHCSFIKKKPFSKYVSMSEMKLTKPIKAKNGVKITEHPLTFEFIQEIEGEFMGAKISVCSLSIFFDIEIESYRNVDKDEIIANIKKTDKGILFAQRLFKTLGEAREAQKNHVENHETFRHAVPISEYTL